MTKSRSKQPVFKQEAIDSKKDADNSDNLTICMNMSHLDNYIGLLEIQSCVNILYIMCNPCYCGYIIIGPIAIIANTSFVNIIMIIMTTNIVTIVHNIFNTMSELCHDIFRDN